MKFFYYKDSSTSWPTVQIDAKKKKNVCKIKHVETLNNLRKKEYSQNAVIYLLTNVWRKKTYCIFRAEKKQQQQLCNSVFKKKQLHLSSVDAKLSRNISCLLYYECLHITLTCASDTNNQILLRRLTKYLRSSTIIIRFREIKAICIIGWSEKNFFWKFKKV